MAAGVPCFPLVSLVLPRRWLVRFVAELSNEGDLLFFLSELSVCVVERVNESD